MASTSARITVSALISIGMVTWRGRAPVASSGSTRATLPAGSALRGVWDSAAVSESAGSAMPESGGAETSEGASSTSYSAGTATVVVPTRDRPSQLAACLDSLRSALREGDELVVVDSASRDAAAVAAVARSAGARLVRCELPGVNRARNSGWRAGSRDVVLFTDDDVVV